MDFFDLSLSMFEPKKPEAIPVTTGETINLYSFIESTNSYMELKTQSNFVSDRLKANAESESSQLGHGSDTSVSILSSATTGTLSTRFPQSHPSLIESSLSTYDNGTTSNDATEMESENTYDSSSQEQFSSPSQLPDKIISGHRNGLVSQPIYSNMQNLFSSNFPHSTAIESRISMECNTPCLGPSQPLMKHMKIIAKGDPKPKRLAQSDTTSRPKRAPTKSTSKTKTTPKKKSSAKSTNDAAMLNRASDLTLYDYIVKSQDRQVLERMQLFEKELLRIQRNLSEIKNCFNQQSLPKAETCTPTVRQQSPSSSTSETVSEQKTRDLDLVQQINFIVSNTEMVLKEFIEKKLLSFERDRDLNQRQGINCENDYNMEIGSISSQPNQKTLHSLIRNHFDMTVDTENRMQVETSLKRKLNEERIPLGKIQNNTIDRYFPKRAKYSFDSSKY